MSPVVTVLYEDSKIGREYPLHALVLRMVEDEINGETWRLLQLVADNPRNGVDNVLLDVRTAALHAGEGLLFVLVDRDRLLKHLRKNARPGDAPLPTTATDDELVAAVRATAGAAASRVQVFLLTPNMEGLIQAIESCAPGHLMDDVRRAKAKDRICRDVVLADAAKARMANLRACIRRHQPGLGALAKALATLIPSKVQPWP